jgi:hypothetical protein
MTPTVKVITVRLKLAPVKKKQITKHRSEKMACFQYSRNDVFGWMPKAVFFWQEKQNTE